jgi:hypothetical protein
VAVDRQKVVVTVVFLGIICGSLYVCDGLGGAKTAPKGAVPAVAHIVRADEPSTCTVPARDWACFAFTMEVFDAPAPRTARVETAVQNRWSSRVQPGAWVSVLVDPKTGEVFLDTAAFAVPAPAAIPSH